MYPGSPATALGRSTVPVSSSPAAAVGAARGRRGSGSAVSPVRQQTHAVHGAPGDGPRGVLPLVPLSQLAEVSTCYSGRPTTAPPRTLAPHCPPRARTMPERVPRREILAVGAARDGRGSGRAVRPVRQQTRAVHGAPGDGSRGVLLLVPISQSAEVSVLLGGRSRRRLGL